MDLNYLLHRHQVSIAREALARGAGARAAHRGLAEGYRGRIRALRRAMGADTGGSRRVS